MAQGEEEGGVKVKIKEEECEMEGGVKGKTGEKKESKEQEKRR